MWRFRKPDAAAPVATTGERRWPWDVLHLFALCAMVVAQPLLDRLQHNPGYIAQELLTPADLVLLAATLLLGPPLMLCGIELLARCWGERVRRAVHLGLIGGLLLVLLTPPINRALETFRKHGIPIGALTLVVVAVLCAWMLRVYARRGWVSSLLTLSAVGLVVFPARFFASRTIAAVCFPEVETVAPAAGNPVPVVLVIFDGLCGMSLLDESHEIDAVRYPNFARLAAGSTWHRNATTVHYRTDNAVPAILSGRIPAGDKEPVLEEYPVNLITLLRNSGQYELTVFEPYTRLAPNAMRFVNSDRTAWDRLRDTIWTLFTVYIETSAPHDVWTVRPPIPAAWFRISPPDAASRQLRTGLLDYGWDAARHVQVDHFLDCLRPVERPTFHCLHLVLPHYPWIYLPENRRYLQDSSVTDYPLGCHGVFHEDWGPDPLAAHDGWQRCLLQLQYTDGALGRILDRLKEIDLYDRCLLVVVADHGEAFVPNRSRREPTRETLPAIAPVPLFVKLPGQTQPERTERNVETIDVLPTIADVLDLPVPGPVDGSSLIDPREQPRARKTMVLPQGVLHFDADFPEKYDYVVELLQQFGSGGADDRVRSRLWRPELIGRRVSECVQGPRSEWQVELEYGGDRVDPQQPEVVPCFFQGLFVDQTDFAEERTLAVAVNGEIAAVTRTLQDPDALGRWSALADERRYRVGRNEVRLYEVRQRGAEVELRRCGELREE